VGNSSMTTLQHPIGILGGTFDPIHIGHLRFALEAHEQLKLDKVHLMPSFQPVHRTPPKASAEHRLEMINRAILNEPALYADPREIRLQKPCFTMDTLAAMREERPETPLCLLVGSDVFLELPTWHRFQDILNFSHIIIGHRPTFQVPHKGLLAEWMQAHQAKDMSTLHHHVAGHILLLPLPLLEVSASAIRTRIMTHDNPRYLLPETVYHYIQQQGIYHS
jgi:nicotinate-nucleotide adenylyltransferase